MFEAGDWVKNNGRWTQIIDICYESGYFFVVDFADGVEERMSVDWLEVLPAKTASEIQAIIEQAS